jgi:NAD(P)-dependent dehydrogenase (short-subunit alcohol dehydrogenase family)
MYFKAYLKIQIRKLIVKANWVFNGFGDAVFGTVLEKHRDIVLVTGGCSGLGHEIVREFKVRSLPKVIVFDLHIPKEEDKIPGVSYYACDVSDLKRIQELAEEIKKDFGIVTVVINNAGITSSKTLLDLSFQEIETIIAVNLTSSFYINKVFLPNMILLKRGYIVTIASVLGYMSPARLSEYRFGLPCMK